MNNVDCLILYIKITEWINEVELCDADNEGTCLNSDWDMNMNSTLETDIYQLNTFDENTFQPALHLCGCNRKW